MGRVAEERPADGVGPQDDESRSGGGGGTAAAAARQPRARDGLKFLLMLALQAAALCMDSLTAGERRLLTLAFTLSSAAFAVKLCAPPLYAARLRAPLLVALRTWSIFMPLVFNTQRMLQFAGQDGGEFGGGEAGTALGGTLPSLVLLLALAWVDGGVLMAVGWPLPPLAHWLAQTLGVGLLMLQVPSGCALYVARYSGNAQLVRGLHWALRQLTSLAFPGTRQHLAAAARAASDAQQCTAVVWSLQVAFGLVLPTLILWRLQLDLARTQAADTEQVTTTRAPPVEQKPEQQPQLQQLPRESVCRAQKRLPAQYRMLCQSALDAADTFTWPGFAGGLALAAYLAAVLATQQ